MALTTAGLRATVISPVAWLIHKGTTFPRRQYFNKALVDLIGIYLLSTQMGQISGATIQALNKGAYSAEIMTVYDNLDYWHRHATCDHWEKLKALDPTKTLTKTTFRGAIEMMGGAPTAHSSTIN